MYYHHGSSGQSGTGGASGGKLHDGPPGVNSSDPRGGQSGWGRHPFQPSNALPIPSPSGFPANDPRMLGFPPPHHSNHSHQPHHSNHGHGTHLNTHHPHNHAHGHHVTGNHPHHPSFGSGSGLHIGSGQGGGGMFGQNGGAFGGMGFGAVGGGQGSPPRSERDMPMTALWQQQLVRAEASRISSAPHHRARTAAMASRMTNKPSAVTIANPADRPSSAASQQPNGVHKKNTSLSVTPAPDRSTTPELSESSTTPGMSAADPANPAIQPAPTDTKEDGPVEPWTGLDLGGIRLKTLSPALFAYSHITSLFINHNALASLPPEISRLRHLTVLDATGNELTSLPPEIGVLSSLKELLLFDNHISTLPPEIGTLFQLEILGIEGNPLEDRLRKIVAEEGTGALIQHFRDNAPVTVSPPERQWVVVEPDVDSPPSGKQESFTVLTYNILCSHFAPASTYKYTPNWALDWNYRKQTILNELQNASADIVCLQEVDVLTYSDFLFPAMIEHGYEGAHYPRSRAKTMSLEEQHKVDGCCIFWKSEKFRLIETQVVEFARVAIQKMDMRTEDMFNRVMSRDNIAVIAMLEFKASGARILVANSHIYWDHRYRDVKLVQIGMLMEELEKLTAQFAGFSPTKTFDEEYSNGFGPPRYDQREKGRDMPFILCVDLNSLSGSAVYDFLSTGEIPPDHEDFMSHAYGPYTAHGLRHKAGLQSACASFGEMKMTNFTPTFAATIDYIFYTPRNLKVTSVLGDVDKEYLDKIVGFPNAHFPSDHIPVYAQFRVRGHPSIKKYD